uniref:Mitochondrial inner membrane protease subunit 2 n=1 Tax=Davidia involucrata TaxID=16924 RepID=A0A5B7A4T0_DAVIN
MGTCNFLWSFTKKGFTFGLISLTITDRYASIVPVQGLSMSPAFNPHSSTSMGSLTDDRVLVEKLCLEKYKFSHGDVIIFCSPNDHKERHIKRITALPGDWIKTPYSNDVLKIPEGHCWVEGDNSASSLDSRSFGPIPLGLVRGRVTNIVWPPQRVGKVERRISPDRLSF